MSNKYILDAAGVPKPADLMTWAKWFEGNPDDRIIAQDQIGEVRVSTVFLGLDHQHGKGPPLLYETMIFGGPHDEYQRRYTTRQQALEGHASAVQLVREDQ